MRKSKTAGEKAAALQSRFLLQTCRRNMAAAISC
jgi:hypothetical protein